MRTNFGIFSDTSISQEDLLPVIGLSEEEDIPDEFVWHYSQMYMGESAPRFSRLSVFRDLNTNNFYGIVFSEVINNENQSVLCITIATLDERLKSNDFLGHIFQSTINNFCNSNPDKETFIKWDEEYYPCNYSMSITLPAKRLSDILCQ